MLLNIPGGDTSRKTSDTDDAGKARCPWFTHAPNVSGGKIRVTENKKRLKTECCFYSASLFFGFEGEKAEHNWRNRDSVKFFFCATGFKEVPLCHCEGQ